MLVIILSKPLWLIYKGSNPNGEACWWNARSTGVPYLHTLESTLGQLDSMQVERLEASCWCQCTSLVQGRNRGRAGEGGDGGEWWIGLEEDRIGGGGGGACSILSPFLHLISWHGSTQTCTNNIAVAGLSWPLWLLGIPQWTNVHLPQRDLQEPKFLWGMQYNTH